MKNKLLIISVLFFSSNIFSQVTLSLQEYDDLKNEKTTLKNEVDSLKKKQITVENNNNFQVVNLQKISKDLSDTIKTLRADLSKLEKFKADKKTIDVQLKTKSDSIALLKIQLLDKEKQITVIRQQGDQKARDEKERGKAETLANHVNAYKKPFDDLIKSSTKETVGRDMQLVGNNPEVMKILNDLHIYFYTWEMFSKKFDATQIKNAQTQLNQIKRQSKLLDTIKDDVEFYQDFNSALKETISKLVNLDKRKSAGGDSEIQKLKFNEIVTILTDYIYNYYDYGKYPYLSDIVLEIIKRKQPNADADIADLLRQL